MTSLKKLKMKKIKNLLSTKEEVVKVDKLVKSQIPMAKKKAPPNLKIGEARKS